MSRIFPLTRPTHGALPARFRRVRVLIVGCGDIGLRVAARLPSHTQVLALTSNPARRSELRACGIRPLSGNLDQPASLHRLAGLAGRVLHLAPPPASGRTDPRTGALLRSLMRRSPPRALVYGSTSGVYGDAAGARFDETRALAPANERAHRRVDAERRVRAFGRLGLRHPAARVDRRGGLLTQTSVLRIPGIYAADRDGGPRERLLRGSPVLRPEDDVFTNHIHADDLARACLLALFRGAPQRVVHVCDDTELRMGDYFDRAADLLGLPRPPRLSRAEAAGRLSPMQLSFMSESRRLDNRRLKAELGLKLLYPTVDSGLADVAPAGSQGMPPTVAAS